MALVAFLEVLFRSLRPPALVTTSCGYPGSATSSRCNRAVLSLDRPIQVLRDADGNVLHPEVRQRLLRECDRPLVVALEDGDRLTISQRAKQLSHHMSSLTT
jgi:hypothetical protein